MQAYQTSDGIRFEADTYSPRAGETLLPALPTWNPATHRIAWSGAAWQVIALTSAQLAALSSQSAAVTAESADKTERTALRALDAALAAGTGTTGERLARLERIARFLIRRLS